MMESDLKNALGGSAVGLQMLSMEWRLFEMAILMNLEEMRTVAGT